MNQTTINGYTIRDDSTTTMTVRVYDKTFGQSLHEMGSNDNDIRMSQIKVMEQLNIATSTAILSDDEETVLRIDTATHTVFAVIPEVRV